MNYTAEFNRDLATVKLALKRGISQRFLVKHRLTRADIDGDLNLGLQRINNKLSGGVNTAGWN